MARRVRSGLIIGFVLIIIFSYFTFGYGKKDKPEIQTERVEGKQQMENNSTHANGADVKEGSASGTEKSEFDSSSDQMQSQLEKWKPLVEELKTALGDIKKDAVQTR